MQRVKISDISIVKEKLTYSPFIHPTNSCYGFGWNIYDKDIYNKIYEIKGRSKSKPFFITVPNIKSIQDIWVYDSRIEEFIWKYPNIIFTFILPRSKLLPSYINPDIETVGVQIAQGPIKRLFTHINFPIFGTSANISGEKLLFSSQQVQKTFKAYDDLIFLDGWNLQEWSPSTIIDLTVSPYTLLRWQLS